MKIIFELIFADKEAQKMKIEPIFHFIFFIIAVVLFINKDWKYENLLFMAKTIKPNFKNKCQWN